MCIIIYDISAKMFLYTAQPFVNILCTSAICETCVEIFWYYSIRLYNYCIIITTPHTCILQRCLPHNRAMGMFIFKVSHGMGSHSPENDNGGNNYPHTQCHSMGLSIMLVFSVQMVYIELRWLGHRNDTQYVSRFWYTLACISTCLIH